MATIMENVVEEIAVAINPIANVGMPKEASTLPSLLIPLFFKSYPSFVHTTPILIMIS